MDKIARIKLRFLLLLLGILFVLSGCKKAYQPETELDISLDVSSEEITGYITAGFLYNSKIDHISDEVQTFHELRTDGIDMLMDYIDACAEEALLVNDGLLSLEILVLDQLDEIQVNADITSYSEAVISNIYAFRLLLDSSVEQMSVYQAVDTKNSLILAEVDGYILSTTSDLVITENAYTTYLLDQLAYIIYIMGEYELDMAYLYNESSAIYEEEIAEAMKSMLFNYEVAGEIHQVIISADYYSTNYFLDYAKDRFELAQELEDDDKIDIDSDMDIEALLDALDYIEDNMEEPTYLLTRQGGVMNVAKKDDILEEANDLLSALDSQPEQEDQGYGVPEFEETMESRVDGIESAGLPINLDASARLVIPSDQVEALNKTATETKIDIGALAMKIDMGTYLLSAFNQSTNIQYDKILEQLSITLVEYGDRMTPEQLDDIRELINGELETLLGDNKAEFVNAILSTTGAELIQRFTEWKDNTAHFNTYDFTANDLVSLVNALGIQIESINLTQPVEDASEPVTIQTGDFELFASDYEAALNQEVLFTLEHAEEIAFFEWSMDDGQWFATQSNEYLYAFTTPGEFAAEVKCFDSQGILLGSATCRVDVIDTGDTSGMDATSASVLALIVEPKDLEGLKASEGLDAIMMFAFGVALPEEDPGDEGLYIYDEYRWVRVAKNSDGTLGAIKTYDWSETDQVTYANTIRFYSTGSLFIREIHQESITDQKKAAFFGGFSNDNIYEYGWHATYFEVEGNLESVLHYSKESKIDQIAISYFDSGEVRATREITYTDGLEGTSLVINYENDTYGYYKYLEEERTVVFGERGRYIGTYDVVEWIEIGGNRDGTFIQYHPDGSINTETSYVDGEYDGQYTTYLLDGGINASGMYVLGEMDGTWTKYDSNTHDYYTIEYNMGDKVD
ncbi:MAG: hypothetical protein PF505_14695 [Vallitaleaceae bacterium]|jgi:antitoxin component YwqK of YwqJK toxin-antitoxin module|nr:hypothetical protein [Vallitaleaceae bacterium]